MNAEIKAKWVEALRSGKYAQGGGRLRQTDAGGKQSFCCLGVLCEIHPDVQPTLTGYRTRRGSDFAVALSDRVRGKVHLKKNEQDTLMWLNDDDNWSFAQIADWIEANL